MTSYYYICCQATLLYHNHLLLFTVEEIKFVRELQDIKVTESKATVELECEISKSGLKLEWFKGDKKIRRDDKFNYMVEDGNVHKLIIDKVSATDAGEYRAVYQKLETSAKLSVAGTHVYFSRCCD